MPTPFDALKPLAGRALEAALNRAVALDPDTGAALAALDGRRISLALESPRVAKSVKSELLQAALADVAPGEVLRFLQAIIRRGRQGLLAEIAQEYQNLVDVKLNRVHAGVILSTDADAKVQKLVTDRLAEALGKDVRAHFRADPSILGGVVVRVGDRVYDGSVRRRLAVLKRRMLTGE